MMDEGFSFVFSKAALIPACSTFAVAAVTEPHSHYYVLMVRIVLLIMSDGQ